MTTDDSANANRAGKGSAYGGTQSPDPNAPDGYQQPQGGKDAGNTDQHKETAFGGEYADDSSYGQQEERPGSAAGEKGNNAETDARGSGIR